MVLEQKAPVAITKAVAAIGTGVPLASTATYAVALWLTAKKVGGRTPGGLHRRFERGQDQRPADDPFGRDVLDDADPGRVQREPGQGLRRCGDER